MEDELEDIYRRNRQGLFSLALAITRCPSRAEDAVHDAFCRLLKGRRGMSGDATAYVFAAVRNAARDALRAGRTPVGRAASIDGEASVYLADARRDGDPSSAHADADERRKLAQAIERLTEEQREAVVMHAIGGLTFAQAAEALGEPLQTVATRYRRALARLREEMEHDRER